jgi:tetratricopeptide (TPR) repeat protein
MKAKPASRTNIDELEAKAHIAMEQRRHKEAIIFYKDLLKQERRPQWEQGLADAYRQRAEQVAGKGMWQEAVILWENHAKLSPQSAVSDAYLGWLVHAGQFHKLAKLVADASLGLEQVPVGRRLPETLAILALQNEKLLAALPQEHPIAKHHTIIKRAIAAYCAGRDEESEEAMRQIPSRSPYRNVRTLLKALLLMGQDRPAGLSLLDRVEADSCCQGFARMLRRQAQPDGPELSAIAELPPKQQALIQKINGYGKAQIALLRDAKKIAKNASNPRLAFNAVLGNRELLGDAVCRRFCHDILVDFPEGLAPFERAFGKLTAFERERHSALHAESRGDSPLAVSHWRQAIVEFRKRPEQEGDPLDEAMIFRHIAKLAEVQVPEIAIDALMNSLRTDPDDQASYIDLVRLNEEIDAPKEAQDWLDKGLKRFPKDVELLSLAMHAASRRKAFKKAAGLAKALLTIDPINSQARQLLIGAHIGHARKQFRAGKFDLAVQELGQARPLDPHRRNASLCMLEGFSALLQQGRKHAEELLAEGWRVAGGGLCAQFQLNVEALSMGQPLNVAAGLVPALDKNHTANRMELQGLAKLLGQHYAEEKKYLPDALKPLKAIFKRSFKQPGLTEDDYFSLGQAFSRSGQFDLLGECATAASRCFPSWPAAIYFKVYAKCKGVASRVTETDEDRLDSALDHARRAKDRRTEVLIETFFRELDEAGDLGYEDDLPPGFEGFDRGNLPALMKRMMELQNLPRAELIRLAAKAMPGLPVKNLPDEKLMDIALLAVMEEFGLDLDSMPGGQFPFGPPEKPPKFR